MALIYPDFCHFFDLVWKAIGLLVRFVGVMASMLPMDLAAFKAIKMLMLGGSWGVGESESTMKNLLLV